MAASITTATDKTNFCFFHYIPRIIFPKAKKFDWVIVAEASVTVNDPTEAKFRCATIP